MKCPCGSQKIYSECCEVFHSGSSIPRTAEQLMRSRYVAFEKIKIEYLKSTHHPDTAHQVDFQATEEWARGAEWLGLKIIRTEQGQSDDLVGLVEFKAEYLMNEKLQIHHEASQFKKEKGQWFYVSGEYPSS